MGAPVPIDHGRLQSVTLTMLKVERKVAGRAVCRQAKPACSCLIQGSLPFVGPIRTVRTQVGGGVELLPTMAAITGTRVG